MKTDWPRYNRWGLRREEGVFVKFEILQIYEQRANALLQGRQAEIERLQRAVMDYETRLGIPPEETEALSPEQRSL